MAPPRFSPDDACAIVAIPASTLLAWRQGAAPDCDDRDGRPFALSDLVALAVTRELAGRVGPRLGDFASGVAQVFCTLAANYDLERADDLSAVIGRDFGFLWPIRHPGQHQERDIVVVPLRPLLRELRDQVFP
jgi:hypothetical protein